jgi:IS5 family transposase
MGNVPDAKTMVRLGQLLDGDALRQVFDRVVAIAKHNKVSRGRRMRVDSTVVEATIRPPTDSRLCEDAVRVVRRGMRKLEEAGVTLPFARARVRTALSRRMRASK